MLHKVFSCGGNGKNPAEYLLKHREAYEPEIVFGDPSMTWDVIKNCHFKEAYTSFVLSCEEKLTKKQVDEMIESYENIAYVGIDKNDISRYYVLHQDHDRTEIHGIVANVHLSTGRRWKHYVDKIDRPRFESWQELTNIKMGLSSPSDPEKMRFNDVPARTLPAEKKALHHEIDTLVCKAFKRDAVQTRDDVVTLLQESGFKVKEGKKQLSIVCDDGRNLRLKGYKYESGYSTEELREKYAKACREHRGNLQERTAKYANTLERYIEKATKRNREYYVTRPREIAEQQARARESSEADRSRESPQPTPSEGVNQDLSRGDRERDSNNSEIDKQDRGVEQRPSQQVAQGDDNISTDNFINHDDLSRVTDLASDLLADPIHNANDGYTTYAERCIQGIRDCLDQYEFGSETEGNRISGQGNRTEEAEPIIDSIQAERRDLQSPTVSRTPSSNDGLQAQEAPRGLRQFHNRREGIKNHEQGIIGHFRRAITTIRERFARACGRTKDLYRKLRKENCRIGAVSTRPKRKQRSPQLDRDRQNILARRCIRQSELHKIKDRSFGRKHRKKIMDKKRGREIGGDIGGNRRKQQISRSKAISRNAEKPQQHEKGHGLSR